MELSDALCLPKTTQNVTPKRIARLEKQNHFLTLLFQGHITFTQAAQQIGISRRQAYRWFQQWKLNEGNEIDREWWQLYNRLLDESPEKAFEGLTRLKYRMTTEKTEQKINITEKKIDVSIIANYSRAIENATKRDLEALRAEQQMDTAESQNTST